MAGFDARWFAGLYAFLQRRLEPALPGLQSEQFEEPSQVPTKDKPPGRRSSITGATCFFPHGSVKCSSGLF